MSHKQQMLDFNAQLASKVDGMSAYNKTIAAIVTSEIELLAQLGAKVDAAKDEGTQHKYRDELLANLSKLMNGTLGEWLKQI